MAAGGFFAKGDKKLEALSLPDGFDQKSHKDGSSLRKIPLNNRDYLAIFHPLRDSYDKAIGGFLVAEEEAVVNDACRDLEKEGQRLRSSVMYRVVMVGIGGRLSWPF